MEWNMLKQEKSRRGFASIDPARLKEIASKGGHGVPPEKRSFSKNRALASQAGKKGGESVPASERSFSQNHDLAVLAGKKGGESRALLFCNDARDEQPNPDDRPKELADAVVSDG